MSITDAASPEGAPSLPPYTETNGSSRAEHEDDTSSLQSHRLFLEDGNVRFQLEDGTLFNVHRYFFKKHAPSFAAEYLQDVAEEPIRLPGVTTVDFERFLTMIYPSEIGERDIETVDEWTAQGDTIEKVVIAREFDLGKDWLLPSFTAICTSSKPLDYEEAERLGLRTVVGIARIREARCRSSDRRSKKSDYDVTSAVLSALVPTRAGGTSPSSNDDTAVDHDIPPSAPDESTVTESSSSPTDLQDAHAIDGTHAVLDTPLAGEDDMPPQANEASIDEAAIPESLLERALYALRLERPAENEPPETMERRRERLSNIVNGILEGNLRSSDSTQIWITPTLSQDNALQCIKRALAKLIARKIFRRSLDAGCDASSGTTDNTSLSVIVNEKNTTASSYMSTLTSALARYAHP
ncbi:hypothetical protein EV714DRAFT_277078 [Schizophyllum commune]